MYNTEKVTQSSHGLSPESILSNASLWADLDRLAEAFEDQPFSQSEARQLESENDVPMNLKNLINAELVIEIENGQFTLSPLPGVAYPFA